MDGWKEMDCPRDSYEFYRFDQIYWINTNLKLEEKKVFWRNRIVHEVIFGSDYG